MLGIADKGKECHDLSTLQLEAKTLLVDFKGKHDISLAYLEHLHPICDSLTIAVNKFVAGKYDQLNLNKLRCEVDAFLKTFMVECDKAERYLNNLAASCDVLLKSSINFQATNDLTCKTWTKSNGRCYSQLNELRCELTALLKDVKLKYDEASGILKALNKGADILKNKATTFRAAHDVSCRKYDNESKGCDQELFELRKYAKIFFADFKDNLGLNKGGLNKLSVLCDDLTNKLNALINELKG